MAKISPTEEVSTGRSARVRRVASSMAEINVVPLVDVMLVLLIIFMVTAPMLQQGIDVNLPVSRRAAVIADERVFVTIPIAYRQNRTVRLNDELVRLDVLAERVRQVMDGRPDREVFVRGDGAIQLQELMEVWDQLMNAGVQKVGMIAKLPGER